MEQEALASNMKNPTPKRISKSTIYYLICGGSAVLLIITLLLLYAAVAHIDLAAWFHSKYAFIAYGAILIYVTVGIILYVKDKIKRL